MDIIRDINMMVISMDSNTMVIRMVHQAWRMTFDGQIPLQVYIFVPF